MASWECYRQGKWIPFRDAGWPYACFALTADQARRYLSAVMAEVAAEKPFGGRGKVVGSGSFRGVSLGEIEPLIFREIQKRDAPGSDTPTTLEPLEAP